MSKNEDIRKLDIFDVYRNIKDIQEQLGNIIKYIDQNKSIIYKYREYKIEESPQTSIGKMITFGPQSDIENAKINLDKMFEIIEKIEEPPKQKLKFERELPNLCDSCGKDLTDSKFHYGKHNTHTSRRGTKTLLCLDCYGYFNERWHAAFDCKEELCFNKEHWTIGD